MKAAVQLLKVLSDENRLRILMLLAEKELCVCQLMGVLGISQPLISRNLSLLKQAGLLDERRDGKLMFYSLRKDMAGLADAVVIAIRERLKDDETFVEDMKSLAECTDFQKQSGKCDMRTFLAYMEQKRKQRLRRRQDVG